MMKAKIFRNPTEEELNRFLAQVQVISTHVVSLAAQASTGMIRVYIFYKAKEKKGGPKA